MISKNKISVVLGLSLISLTSVGFSSWVITATPATVEGTIQVDELINSSEYIYLNTSKGNYIDPDKKELGKSGIDIFGYTNEGFYKQNDEKKEIDKEHGYLTLYFILDIDKCVEKFGTNITLLNLDLSLKYSERYSGQYSDFNIFKYIERCSTTNNNNINISNTKKDLDNKSYDTAITFNNLPTNGKLDFDLTYDFNYIGANFGSEISVPLNDYYDNGIRFSLTTKLSIR